MPTWNTNRNPLVQLKETKYKRNLLARVVFGAQLSHYWANGRLQNPGI